MALYLAALDSEADRIKMSDLYDKHKSTMLRYALSITNNRELAEDAVHNAFLAIIKHKEKYLHLSRRDFRSQIVIITKNKCIDLLRKEKVFVDDQIDEMEDVLESDDIPIEEQILLNEEYESLKKHIASLDETSRLVLEMKYLNGMTYKEISEALKITTKHVETKIMRAKEKVRKLVMKGGDSLEH